MLSSEVSASYSRFSLLCVFLCPLREVLFSFFFFFVNFVNVYESDLEDDYKLPISDFLLFSVILFFVLVFLSLFLVAV